MRLGLLLALICLSVYPALSNPHDYNPGISFMMRDVLITKFREIIIPQIMNEFRTIKPADMRESHWYAEFALYDLRADVIPLKPEQLIINTVQERNSLYVRVNGFQMNFQASAYARILFIGMHGHGEISMKVETFEFEVQPKIREDGNFNALTYDVPNIHIKVNAGDINIHNLSIGFLPSWLLDPIANLVIHNCQGAINAFINVLEGMIKKILDDHKNDIPDQVEIPNTSLSASLSFPNVPKLYNDRVEVPFDGTIFLTKEGYNPQQDHANPMPSFDSSDPNNIQFFVNQHVLKSDIAAVKKANLRYMITKDLITKFQLPDDVFTVKYFALLFPFLSCHYDSNVPIKISLGLDTKLDTSITFFKGGMKGNFSPSLQIYAGEELAFTLSMTAGFTANIDFKVKDKASYAHGALMDVSLSSMSFEKGTVEDSDLPTIVENFKNIVYPAIKKTTDAILDYGIDIPVIPLFNGIFKIDLEMIYMKFMDEYLQVSFTLDIHQKIKMWKALHGIKGLGAVSKLEHLLKQSETCNIGNSKLM